MQVAIPVVVFTVTVPHPEMVVPLSLKAIVPPSGTGATVAVYVTICPTTLGFTDETTPVVVAEPLTTWVRGPPPDPEKAASPEYTDVIMWSPAAP
jgi:hypothetical protein